MRMSSAPGIVQLILAQVLPADEHGELHALALQPVR
jgi:hypothetical protein